MYTAQGKGALVTVLAEVYQRTRVIDLSQDDPWLVGLELERNVRLLDTSGSWPVAAGGSQALNSGRREAARAWSREIYRQYPSIQGIWYPSSLCGMPGAASGGMTACVALYERSRFAIPKQPMFHRALNDPAIRAAIRNAAGTITYDIVE